MLDEYCSTLSDKAQLQLALNCCRQTVDTWEVYFKNNPEFLNKINASETTKEARIGPNFPAYALLLIESAYSAHAYRGVFCVSEMKKEEMLVQLYLKAIKPLLLKDWDEFLPLPVRLSYTSVWNILCWLVYKRKNTSDETHIYLSLNQAADLMLQKNILDKDGIEKILLEFKEDLRNEEEDSYWEQSTNSLSTSSKDEIPDSVYQSIISGPPKPERLAKSVGEEVVRQMRMEGKTFWSMMEEYYSGTSTTYGYDTKKNEFTITEIDVIVGSFCNEYIVTEADMIDSMQSKSLSDLRDSGFEV